MSLPILPPLVWVPSPNHSPRHEPIRGVVVHETEGAYASAVSWFATSRSQVSAHVVLREDGRQATQCVGWDQKAWHAVNANGHTLGLELAGRTSQPNADWQLRTAARIVAYWCHRYSIPARQADPHGYGGICRHRDLGSYGGGHGDPGGFDWEHFVGLVAAELKRGRFRPSWGRS
jgi:N-acetyl-anhydromuramyl-L-alanine amidase AmpD